MITILAGNYNLTEKENLSELFSYLADTVCSYCDIKTGVQSSLKCRSCQYKHIIRDMRGVDCPKKNDNSVT